MRLRVLSGLLVVLAFLMSVSPAVVAQEATATTEITQEATPETPPTEQPTEVATELPTEPPTLEATTPAATDAETPTTPTPTATEFTTTTYVVRSGDTLARIAARFNTTIAVLSRLNGIPNTNLIYVGQTLRVPVIDATPTSTPSPTVSPIPPDLTPSATVVPGETYIVRVGDTLFKIAVRFNTTVTALMALNNLDNPNLIYVGQRLILPASSGTPVATLPATADATPDATSAATTVPTAVIMTPTITTELEDPGFASGVAAFVLSQDANALAQQITTLGVEWVRVNAYWGDIEVTQGQPDYTELDQAVEAFDAAGLNILLTVSTAPDWARTRLEEEGPPDDFALYAQFIGGLAARYAGRVDAYQVWYEPNLRREWFSESHPISAQSYVELLKGAYAAVKAADPAASVISAGLSPTGFNDGFNAINDRVFLMDLYAQDVMSYSDAISAHLGGWANPPDATCCEAAEGVETHFQDRSFFFQDTLNDYRLIMIQNRDNRPLWVTKFGWGSSADMTPPGEESGYIYVTYTDLEEQAAYDARGFALGQELGFIGPMFLHNLNGCVATPVRAENCYASLIGPDGAPRPAFNAVQAAVGQ